jgi:3-hydroxyisobutyrate dehydrogenase-like beta-hydroxyacid dehydrogenase
MANDTKRVGWIGLGDLGGAMARRIQSQGVSLAVYDIDAQAVRRLTEIGAQAAGSIRELAERSDIVMLSLPHPTVLEEVVLGVDGLVHALAPGSIVCDTSTNGRDAVVQAGARLAEKGIRMVEGPIGKGPWAAERGELTIMMGGDRETLREIEFLFRLIGNELYYCGPLGAGQVVKVANNLASCANLAVAAEAYALAAAGGADLDVVTRVMPQTAADSWQLRNGVIDRAHRRGDFAPVFKLKLARKDLQLAAAMLRTLGLPSACAEGALAWYDQGHGAGYDDLDQSAVLLTTNPELRRG